MTRSAFVPAERANHAVAAPCRVVGASASGFYAWLWLRPLAAAPGSAVELVWVGALRPGHGEGGAGMRALVTLADRAGVALRMRADPWGAAGG